MKTPRHAAYLLLEVVVATGLLILGLAVIGAQVQESQKSVRQMQLGLRAVNLAEQYLAEMDLGLIELDSLDDVQEEDFGPRYPDFAWRLTTQETATSGMFLLTLEVLHKLREDYDEEEFDFDNAETVYTLHTIRATPQPIDLSTEFGLTEDEVEDLREKLSATGIEDLTPESFDPSILAKVDTEQLMEVLPILLDALGQDVGQLLAQLPPDVAKAIQESGLLNGGAKSGEGDGSKPPTGGANPNAGNQPTGSGAPPPAIPPTEGNEVVDE